MNEAYILLFIDSFRSNIIFNLSHEMAFHSMKIFGLYNEYIMIIVGLSGFIIASAINYLIGRLLLKLIVGGDVPDRIIMISKNPLTYIFLILTGVVFYGKFLSFFAGFIRLRFNFVIAISLISKLLFYLIL